MLQAPSQDETNDKKVYVIIIHCTTTIIIIIIISLFVKRNKIAFANPKVELRLNSITGR